MIHLVQYPVFSNGQHQIYQRKAEETSTDNSIISFLLREVSSCPQAVSGSHAQTMRVSLCTFKEREHFCTTQRGL